MNQGKQIQKATFSQKLRVFNLLKDNLEKVDDDTWQYLNGMDDYKIAKMAECNVTAAHVAGLRRSEFGNFPKTQRGGSNLLARVEQLEKALANVIKCHHELAQKHDTLCNTLALNKVANVRHLAVSPINEVRANGNAR